MSLLNLNSPAGQTPRGKKGLKMWMGTGLVVAVLGIGSTFAANININQNEETEFGQGVTKTVFCGGRSATITVSPLSKFVNGEEGQRLVRAGVQAVPENSFTARFATSSYSGSSDFIVSATPTKTVNNRTGVWLTKRGDDSVAVATNQDERTFSTQQRSDYVFSQNAATRTINNVSTRGFYKVNNSLEEKIVIAAAIAGRQDEYEDYETDSEFNVKGVVISDIPDDCDGRNFIISGYNNEDEDAEPLIKVISETPNLEISEIAVKWTHPNSATAATVSRDRTQLRNIAAYVSATQTATTLSVLFDKDINAEYLKTEDLYRLVIETQENTLG